MKNLQHIKAIVCDWDDTKVATIKSCLDLYKSFSTAYGVENPTDESVSLHWGKPMKLILPALWPMVNPEEIEEKFREHALSIDFCLKPFPDTEKTILALKKKGYVLGVISSGPRFGMQRTLDRYFSLPADTYHFFYSGEDFPFHKPDPRVFDAGLTALKKLNIEKEDVLYVGDSLVDYQAAKAKGILFIAVTTGMTSKDTFINAGLDKKYILSAFSKLPYMLEKQSLT